MRKRKQWRAVFGVSSGSDRLAEILGPYGSELHLLSDLAGHRCAVGYYNPTRFRKPTVRPRGWCLTHEKLNSYRASLL
jgi:hypothetical protein